MQDELNLLIEAGNDLSEEASARRRQLVEMQAAMKNAALKER